jgi:hypothetical protein
MSECRLEGISCRWLFGPEPRHGVELRAKGKCLKEGRLLEGFKHFPFELGPEIYVPLGAIGKPQVKNVVAHVFCLSESWGH